MSPQYNMLEKLKTLIPRVLSMSSPEKKKKPSTQNLSLPDDLLVSCFARVSRLYYPTLSLVSKSFRSLIASPELYQTRSLLNRTESCLYVCLKFPPDPNPRWFTLCRKLDKTLTNDTSKKKKKKKEPSGYILAPFSILHSPQVRSEGAHGYDIYNIGGSIEPSSCVSILDCRSHTWREAPNMRVERLDPAANVVDGKIYVAGGCKDFKSLDWMEVFDPKTQTWELVSCPFADICESWIGKSAVIEGKIYMFGHKSVAYTPKEEKWEAIRGMTNLDLGWAWLSYCVIDNILYCYNNVDGIKWYDSEIGHWFYLTGLRRLPKFADYSRVKLADYGGKLVVLWDKYLRSSGYQNKMIWCAVIALERRSDQEIWGEVEWLDAVLTVPKSYEFVSALSATV